MTAKPAATETDKKARRRRQQRERMAEHRAALKTLPPEAQQAAIERARAARARYRAQHRAVLIAKERDRREAKSRESNTLDEFIRRRCARQAKASKRLSQAIQPGPSEPDELMDY
ncbi:hypothetical protein DFH06DRAFT_1314365 [Mycena polygramma]|nr:hypothetical protein DFH06DRAFT_1314365 [Mycena polygramma]